MAQLTALVLGATGGIGGAVARRLLAANWRVRALTRHAGTPRRPGGCEWIVGDAMNAADVAQAAAGCALVVHAVNPPGYRGWEKLVLPMLDNSIAAARSSGARLLLPGTVYNYGTDVFPTFAEDAPQHPHTRKGAIRVEMEQRLHSEAASGDITALIVRTGDFFGPQAGNSWFSQGMVKPGRRPTVIHVPGQPGIGHQWAYLPDVAETMVRLVEQGGLDDFATFHMAGHWDADGTALPDSVVRVLGEPGVRIAPLPWWALRIAGLVATTPRELLEMKYLWERPVRMTNARVLARLGTEPHTPLDDAIRTTLAAMRCL